MSVLIIKQVRDLTWHSKLI